MISYPNVRPVRVLLLFSDPGGGHRSAADALREAWALAHPGRVRVHLVDWFRDYAPFPFNQAGPSYPYTVRYFRRLYAAAFRSTDGPRRARALVRAVYRYVRPH